MTRKACNNINEIFYNVQFNKTCHPSNIKNLKKCYERVRIDYNTILNSLYIY